MTATLGSGILNIIGRKMVSHTLTSLKRWSCQNIELPPISQIKAVHVYDFDNTLFMSPLPNPKLWIGQTVGYLQTQESFANGGWWHDNHILEATGQGIEKEEPRAWDGWWNEQIVNLVELSMRQRDALTVLLTGRAEHTFADLIKRMVASKKLQADMICLKPQVGPMGQRFSSTMHFKQVLLEDLVLTYGDAEEIRVYEDRPKHVKGFRDFFEKFNKSLLAPNTYSLRRPITAEVIQVAEVATTLDPVTETAEIQRMINSHNASLASHTFTNNSSGRQQHNRLQLKRTIYFTGYLISPADTAKLLTLMSLPPGMPESEVKYLANNILITPRPCPKSILDKVGGIGARQIWQVTHTAIYESKIWAARVQPIPSSASFYTENPVPIIVLALRKGARPIDAGRIQNWQPVGTEKQFVFETVVGEKVQLRVEPEVEGEGEYESLFAGNGKTFNKRRYAQEEGGEDAKAAPSGPQGQRGYVNDENRRPGGLPNGGYRGGSQNRGRGGGGGNNRNPPHSGRGGRNGNRGGGGGGIRGRGRGGYKSLDDVGNSPRYGQGNGYQNHQPNYDDPPNYTNGIESYNAAFPPMARQEAGGYGNGNSNSNGNGSGNAWNNNSGGLPYGH